MHKKLAVILSTSILRYKRITVGKKRKKKIKIMVRNKDFVLNLSGYTKSNPVTELEHTQTAV